MALDDLCTFVAVGRWEPDEERCDREKGAGLQ